MAYTRTLTVRTENLRVGDNLIVPGGIISEIIDYGTWIDIVLHGHWDLYVSYRTLEHKVVRTYA